MKLAFNSSLLISDEAFVALQPSVIKRFGRSAAQVLATLHYFLQHSKNLINGVYWVYNTYAQWKDQIPGLSIRTLQRVMTQLEALGIIRSERYEAHRWYQRKWYTIDYDRLKGLILNISPKEDDRSRQNGDIVYKDISTKKIKETNTSAPPVQPLNPTPHPVKEMEKEVNKGDTGLEPITTVDRPIKEKPKPKKTQEPQPNTPVTPNPNPQQTSDSSPQTIAPEIEREIIEIIAPTLMNQNLLKQVVQAQTEVILNAIAVVKERKAKGEAKNPAGLLVSAIQNQWKPNPSNTFPKAIPDDFNEWYALAHRAGLALGSTLIDGVMYIYTNTQKSEPYEEFRSGFSLPWLKNHLGIP